MGRAPDANGGATRLVTVKAVSQAYPLRGALRLSSAPGSAEVAVTGAPERGSVWVDPALLEALNLKVGDPLLLGDAQLRIARVIVIEPDRGAGFLSFAPRVMLNLADLPATGLVQPASRVTWRLAVAAPPATTPRRCSASSPGPMRRSRRRRCAALRVESLATGRPEMRQTLDRAGKFLNLVALLAALLAAVAVGIAARDFASRHLDDCAMLRVLGQPQRAIALRYLIEFGAGRAARQRRRRAARLRGAFRASSGCSPAWSTPRCRRPSAWPALFGVGVGLTLLLGFGLPPVLQLARVPPLRVIRRDVGALKPASIAVLVAGTLGFVALLLAVSQRPEARADRGRRLRRGGGAVRAAVVARGAAAAARGARGARAALAGAGDAADRRATGLRGAAGLGAQRRPAGAGAAGAAAHRPDQQLAPGDAAGRAEPLRHQRPAGAGRRRSSSALRDAGVAQLRLVPDDPRPPGRDQRQAGPARRPGRPARAAAARARVQPQPHARRCRRTTRSAPGAGRPTRPTRVSVEDGPGADARA